MSICYLSLRHDLSEEQHMLGLKPARSRVLALLAWIVALYAFISVILINTGGVSLPLPSAAAPKSRLGNTGFEIIEWLSDGSDDSIPNYYHFRLYLNRLCAVNPSQQRGTGLCYNHSFLGLFKLSKYFPDSIVNFERAYDAVIGRVDLFSPLVFSAAGAVCCAALILLAPATFIADDAGSCSSRMILLRSRTALMNMAGAVTHTAFSVALTITFASLRNRMESIPQVSLIFSGHVPLAMAWVASGSLIVTALLLQDDIASARSACRALAHQRLLERFTSDFESDIFSTRASMSSNEDADGWGATNREENSWMRSELWWLEKPLRRRGADVAKWIWRRGRRRASSGAKGTARMIAGLLLEEGARREPMAFREDLKTG